MSVFRVITRIIPLNSSEGAFEPVPFSVLTDGISREIKVLNLTEPETGMNYRIERIEDIQNVGPGESIDSVNKAFAEKLKNIPGFVQLKANDAQQNLYSKSFKLTLPQVVSLNCDDGSSDKNTNSLTISVVKNCDLNNINSPSECTENSKKKRNDTHFDIKSPKHKSVIKKSKYTVAANKDERNNAKSKYTVAANKDERNDAKINLVLKKTKSLDAVYENRKGEIYNDIRTPKNIFKSKYPTYLSKRLKKSTALRNKMKSPKRITKRPKPLKLKFKKSDISYFNECNENQTPKTRALSPTSEEDANSDTDTVQDLDVKACEQQHSEAKSNGSLDKEENRVTDKSVDIDREKTDSVDDFLYDFESGDLVINELDATDSASEAQQEETSGNKCDKSTNDTVSLNNIKSTSDVTEVAENAITKNSCSDNSSVNVEEADLNTTQENNTLNDCNIYNKFLVPTDHPLYDILQPLKKYFVNNECIICGFICADENYNCALHMESHVFVDSSPSSYKCHCCDEHFSSPRTLYKHALSREKSYKYMCNKCLLKFKRQHYLVRHTLKAHPVT